MAKDKMNSFSISLGLFDYINPLFYSVTTLTIIRKLGPLMARPIRIVFVVGAILSLIFGFTIPTVKLLVGLGKMSFKMPVNLVFYVNSGILLSGLSLLKYAFDLKLIYLIVIFGLIVCFLSFVVYKTKKFNTIAVLAGAFGYLFIYCSLISLALAGNNALCAGLYFFAIALFVFLCFIGIKADLMNPRIHWLIEIANVICQFTVALSTVILLK